MTHVQSGASKPRRFDPGFFFPRAMTGEVPRLVRLSLPIAGISLTNMAMSVTDTAMAAWFGTVDLAAVAVGSDFYSILFYLIAGLCAGLAPAYAAASAQRDRFELAKLRVAGWVVTLCAALLAFPLVWFAPNYLGGIGIEAQILDTGRGYTQAMACTLFPMAAICLLRNRLTAIEHPGAILRVTLMAIPVNAAMNYLFMFGVAGWPGLGVTGAGVSSFITATLIALALAHITRKHGDYGLVTILDIALVRQTVRVGLPISITTLAEFGVYLGSTLFIARFGAEATAAHAIVLRLAGVTYSACGGLSQASTVRLARADAEQNRALIHATVGSSAFLSGVIGLGLLVGLTGAAFGSLVLLPMVGFSASATQMTFWLILVLGITELVEPVGCAASGLLRGRSDTRVPMIFALVGNWGVGVPAGLALSLWTGLGVIGVWLGLFAGLSVAAGLTIARAADRFGYIRNT